MPLHPTRVPAVIDRLVDVLTAHPDLADVLVLGGPLASGDYHDTTVIIGWTDEDRPAATVVRTSTGMGIRPRDEESWSLWCMIGSVDGSTDSEAPKLARHKVAEAFAVIEYLVTDDPQYGVTLGDVCGQAAIGDQEWWQAAVAEGIEVALLFKIVGKVLL